jgi:hypothetical protein
MGDPSQASSSSWWLVHKLVGASLFTLTGVKQRDAFRGQSVFLEAAIGLFGDGHFDQTLLDCWLQVYSPE